MRRRLPAISGQAAWGLGDQIFSSATNFGVNILIARSLGAASFGAFSVAFAAYVLILNLSRAVNTEPLAIRFSAVPESSWRVGAARSSAATLAVGALGSIACAVVALVSSGDLRASFLALVITLPGLLYADLWRFAFFAAGHGRRAMITDVLWAVVMFPVVLWLLSLPDPSLLAIALAWAGSAAIAGLTVTVLWGVRPAFSEIGIWLREHRDLTPAFVGELATVSGAVQIALIGMGIVANLAAVGAYRAAYVLFGPLRVVYQGMTLFGVPAAVRALAMSPRRLRTGARAGALFLATIAVGYGAILMVMPSEWGEFILGPTWAPVEPLIVPFTIGILAIGLDTPTYIGLRALEAAGTAFRTRLVVATADVAATITGAALGGAVGAAWAGKSTQLVGSALWWKSFSTRLAEREEWSEPLPEGAPR